MSKKTSTPLTPKEIKELATVGIKGETTSEGAKKKLLALLKDNDIEDVEEESLKDLIEMYEAFYEEVAEEEEEEVEEEETEEEEELETLSKETEKKNSKKQAEVKKKNEKALPAKKKVATKIDKTIYEPLHKIFPEDKFEYAYLAKGGVSIKHLGKNAKKVVLTFDNLSHIEDEVTGDAFFLKGIPGLADFLSEHDTHKSWSGRTFIKKLSVKEIAKLITKDFKIAIMGKVEKADKTLAVNRDKMEKNLKGGDKKAEVKKVEVKEALPAKKATATPAKKAAVKKPAPAPVKAKKK